MKKAYQYAINEHIQHFAQIIATVQTLQALISVGFVQEKEPFIVQYDKPCSFIAVCFK